MRPSKSTSPVDWRHVSYSSVINQFFLDRRIHPNVRKLKKLVALLGGIRFLGKPKAIPCIFVILIFLR
jgi:hypothetical protein